MSFDSTELVREEDTYSRSGLTLWLFYEDYMPKSQYDTGAPDTTSQGDAAISKVTLWTEVGTIKTFTNLTRKAKPGGQQIKNGKARVQRTF